MGRALRTNAGDYVYHVLNRANARIEIFNNDKDYKLFEKILEEAKEKYDMRILGYCLMPNHWHIILTQKEMVIYQIGKDNWTEGIIKKFNLELTIGLRGRPKKGSRHLFTTFSP